MIKRTSSCPKRLFRKPGKNFIWYLGDLLLLIMIWGGFYRCRLADSDTLWGDFIPSNTLIARLTNFRWLGFVGDYVSYHVFHYYPFEHQRVSLLLFLIVLAICLLLVQKTFTPFVGELLKSIPGKMVYFSATALIFSNVLFAEHFYFTDAFLNFKSAFFFCTAGCFLWERKHYIWGTLFIFFSSMFYQVTCADAALILMTVVFLEEKGHFSLKLLKNEIFVILVPLGAGVLNYASGPFILRWINSFTGWDLSSSKSVSAKPIGQTVRELINSFSNLYESSLGLMIPAWLPLLFSLLVTLSILAILFRCRDRNGIGTYCLYKVGIFIVMCALQIMSSTWEFTPRIISTFYFMQSLNAVVLLWLCSRCLFSSGEKEMSGADNKASVNEREAVSEEMRTGYGMKNHDRAILYFTLRKVVMVSPIVYLCAQSFFIQVIIANRCVSEMLDTVYANAILDKVEKYEAETGNSVFRMTFCNDADSSPYYPEVQFHSSAINKRLYGTGTYSLIETMALQRGRHFDVEYKEQSGVEELFAGKNWNSFNPDEQILIDGDTLYVCAF